MLRLFTNIGSTGKGLPILQPNKKDDQLTDNKKFDSK